MADYLKLLSFTCAFCGSTPGNRCRTALGGRAVGTHADRFLQEATEWKREHPSSLEDAARGR